MKLSHVPPEEIDLVWPQVEKQIKKAYSTGAGDRSSPEHLYKAVQEGMVHCLAVHEGMEVIAAVFLSVKDFPTMRVLFVELLAGRDMDSWLGEMEPVLQKYKELLKADKIEASVRPGLAKRLKNWRQKSILLEFNE